MQIQKERCERIQETRNRHEIRRKTDCPNEKDRIVKKNVTIESSLNDALEKDSDGLRNPSFQN